MKLMKLFSKLMKLLIQSYWRFQMKNLLDMRNDDVCDSFVKRVIAKTSWKHLTWQVNP